MNRAHLHALLDQAIELTHEGQSVAGPFVEALIVEAAQEALRARAAERAALEALEACVAYIPGSEVRSWPPGFELKRQALTKARAVLATVNPTTNP